MKTKILLKVVLILIISNSVKAFDSTAAKFYPVNTGNVFIYRHSIELVECIPASVTKFRVTITGDTLLDDGKVYKIFSGFESLNWTYQRIDSNTMNVYSRHNGNTYLLDSLYGQTGQFNGRRNPTATSPAFISSSSMTVFNENRNARFINNGYHISSPFYYSLVQGIGLYHIDNCLDFGQRYVLTGCVIDGIVYGDTVLTDITKISTTIPDKFSLHQNFPNPFNPSTAIDFEITETGFVSLKVFNLLGEEVTQLVKEQKSPGTYRVTFHAGELASGVYFYQLNAGRFVETRKMLLMK